QHIKVLSVALWIASAATVAETDVEKTVLAECQAAAVVIRKRLVDGEQNVLGAGIGEVRICGRCRESGDHRLQLASDIARVVHEKAAVLQEHLMKGQPQPAGVAAAGEAGFSAAIPKRRRGASSVALDDLNVPSLFDYEEPSPVIVWLLNVEWIGETGSDDDQIESCGFWRWHGRRWWCGRRTAAASTAQEDQQQSRGNLEMKHSARLHRSLRPATASLRSGFTKV